MIGVLTNWADFESFISLFEIDSSQNWRYFPFEDELFLGDFSEMILNQAEERAEEFLANDHEDIKVYIFRPFETSLAFC